MFTNPTRAKSMNDKKRYRHYIHSPFQLDHQGIKVEVDEHGKIKMTQDHGDDTYDEITFSASLINRVSRMLMATRKVVFRDDPFKGEDDMEYTEDKN